MTDIPATTSIQQRPVYARALRRQAGYPVLWPPMGDEVYDAIRVLAETWDGDPGFGDITHVEATRILDGCGSS